MEKNQKIKTEKIVKIKGKVKLDRTVFNLKYGPRTNFFSGKFSKCALKELLKKVACGLADGYTLAGINKNQKESII